MSSQKSLVDGRDEDTIESDRENVGRMRMENYSNREIVAWFHEQGRYDIDTVTVSRDWLIVRRKWIKSISPEMEARFQEQVIANDHLIKTAWRKYRRVESTLQALQEEEARAVTEADSESIGEGDTPRRPSRNLSAPFRRALSEQTFWWNQIVRLQEQRARLLGLTSSGINVNIDNRAQSVNIGGTNVNLPEKIYLGFDPDRDWPVKDNSNLITDGDLGRTPVTEYVEAEYEDT